ncbi:RNA-directed DNA polymerase, eukaryota, reverse transcriptase zinc-binding domain protein, partial [Tanacetum coccineum]
MNNSDQLDSSKQSKGEINEDRIEELEDVYSMNDGMAGEMNKGDLRGMDENVLQDFITNGHPWAISGDFNVTLHPNEHSAGSSSTTIDMMEFNDFKLGDYTGILKKLDRIMVSEEFMGKFPQAHAIFMPYLIYDHNHALLIIPNVIRHKKKSFKIANYITEKEEFCRIVEEKWKADIGGLNMYNLVKKLKSLKHPLNNLNWSNGNLVEKVKVLKEDLKSIQAAIDADPFDKCLRDKGSAILEKYVEAVKDEEKLLFQKCKIKWLSYGDKNNSFFHKMLKGRNQRNKIQDIHDTKGQRYDGDKAAFQFVNHFKQFLGLSVLVTPIANSEELFTTKLSSSKASQMVKPVTDREIKKAMFNTNHNKAPGPDGSSAKFFKAAWHIVGPDVCTAVKEFLSSGKLLGELNATIISLIPKINIPLLVTDFRPIACCNVVYKCISKVITERIKGCLDKLINKNQSAFIPSRLIQDNILLAQDLMQGYNRVGDPKRVAFKIDIQKAYDTVIKETIDEFGKCSGLLRNFNKSTVFFGSIKEDEQQVLLSILPFVKGKLPVMYLGVPLISKKLGFKDYKCLIDKTVINDINKIMKNFLWSQSNESKGSAKVAWKDVCWKNGSEWVDSLPCLSTIAVPVVKNGKRDKIVWINNNGDPEKFTMKNVYDSLRIHIKARLLGLNVKKSTDVDKAAAIWELDYGNLSIPRDKESGFGLFNSENLLRIKELERVSHASLFKRQCVLALAESPGLVCSRCVNSLKNVGIETDHVRLVGVQAEGEGCSVGSLLIDATIVGSGGASGGGSQGWALLRRVLDECSTCTLDFNIQHHLPSVELHGSDHSRSIGSLRVVAALSEFYFLKAKVLISTPML